MTTKKKATKRTAAKTSKAPTPKSRVAAKAKNRPADTSRPATGSALHRSYKGRQCEIRVLAEGYEFEGQTFASLTAVAKHITGYAAISGPEFFKRAKSEVK